MSNSVKIQINSKEALERLIGGSSETEIQLRNAVVQAFTQAHLKSIALAQLSTLKNAAAIACEKVIRDTLGDSSYRYGYGIVLKDEARKAIADETMSVVKDHVNQILSERLETLDIKSMVEKAVAYKVNVLINEEVHRQVNEKLKQIKDKL